MTTVQDILNESPDKLGDRSRLFPLLNKAIRFVSGRLLATRSNIIASEVTLNYIASDESQPFNSSFWGMKEQPYDTSNKKMLFPLPDQQTKVDKTYSEGDVQFYLVLGQSLFLYSVPTAALEIKLTQFNAPTKLTKHSDTLPHNGIFDDVIVGMLHYYINPENGAPPTIADIDLISKRYGLETCPSYVIDF